MKLIELKGSAKKTFINTQSIEGIQLLEGDNLFYVTINGQYLSVNEIYTSLVEAENRLEQILMLFDEVSELEKA
jgi:hypothetical protein